MSYHGGEFKRVYFPLNETPQVVHTILLLAYYMYISGPLMFDVEQLFLDIILWVR